MTDTVSIIFTIMMHGGCYSDKWTTVVRSFTERRDADRYVARKNSALDTLRGMVRAADILVEEWDKSHPRPEYPSSEEDHSTYNAWDEARCKEVERIELLLGIEKEFSDLGLSRWRDDDVSYNVVETPLGGSPHDEVTK